MKSKKTYNLAYTQKTRVNKNEMTVPLIESFPQMKYEEMESEDNMSTGYNLHYWGFLIFQTSKVIPWGVYHHLHHYFNWKWPLHNTN